MLLEGASRAVGHGEHGHGIDLEPSVGQHVVGRGHLEWRCLEGPEGQRGIGLDVVGDAELLRPDRRDPVVPHHLGHLHRGHVQAVGEGTSEGDVAVVPVLVVLGDVLLVLVEEDGGCILDHGRGRDRRQRRDRRTSPRTPRGRRRA